MASILTPYLRKRAITISRKLSRDEVSQDLEEDNFLHSLLTKPLHQRSKLCPRPSIEVFGAVDDEDLSDTLSLTLDDLSFGSPTTTSEDSRVYGYGCAVPDHDSQFVREKDVKSRARDGRPRETKVTATSN